MGAYSTLILLILLTINIIILIWSIWEVIPNIGDSRFSLFLVTPWIVDIVELGGTSLAVYHVLLVVAICLSFIWMINRSLWTFVLELRIRPLGGKHSPLYLIGTIFFSLIAFNFFYYLTLGAGGIFPETPGFEEQDLWKLLFAFANASVWEELITRVLFIGIPLLIYHLIRRKSRRLRSYIIGGGFDMGGAEVVLLVFSSGMFAAAHLNSWDAFKMLPTFIAGLALGYLFLRVGLYASIMLHFAFDYLSVPIDVSQSMVVTMLIGLVMLAWIVVGSCYFYYYATRVMGFLLGKELWPPRILRERGRPTFYIPSVPMPSRDGSVGGPRAGMAPPGGFGFSCKYCGHTEARYKDGEFHCLRCGGKN